MQHDEFQLLLDRLVQSSGIGQEVLGEVLARTSLRAPAETSRVEISAGNPNARRPVDQRAIPQGTVSKAVKALKAEDLLEDGETFLKSQDGRPLSPLRLGSAYAIAGVKVLQTGEQPRRVTTALLGLDGSRVLGTAHDTACSWEDVAKKIHERVAQLKRTCDGDRASRGQPLLRLFGVGIEVGAPVHEGNVMPLSRDGSRVPVPLSATLHGLFETDPVFDRPVPVIVENDVNALAVLAIHQVHYAEPDLVVVGVFDEGVGGGLVMDGRLRRGGSGRAMEIGHLAVGFPPGQSAEMQLMQEQGSSVSSGGTATGFSAPCSCGQFGHIDTLATPVRITGEFGGGGLDKIAEIDPLDQEFSLAHEIFRRGGAALGRALAHVSNTVDPSRIIVYLPGPLAEPKPDTAAAAYLTAMREEATRAFAASSQADYLTIRPFPAKPEDAALLGARAAAVCVLESFIEHALRLDGCSTGLRRPGGGNSLAG